MSWMRCELWIIAFRRSIKPDSSDLIVINQEIDSMAHQGVIFIIANDIHAQIGQ